MTERLTPNHPVIPDGSQSRSGTQPLKRLSRWVPALRFAAAGMTAVFQLQR